MMSVLLLTFTVSTDFVSRAYAPADFPTSDLSPKIRDWINNQMREDPFPPSSSPVPMSSDQSTIRLTLSGFPRQTGESITNIDLRPSPCPIHNVCTGFSNIMIPGIGGGTVYVVIRHLQGQDGQSNLQQAFFLFLIAVASLSLPILIPLTAAHLGIINGTDTNTGHIINGIISGNGAVTRTIYIPGIGSGQATVQLS